ncbi:MAG: bifunctional lysylphosphatidylglycerol flippase/synthetase MprF [Stagnimonas sp.]|nr:bifunctional lysylphosphatidylglycerol flippase/synthetase MprF [Stagnimonas sp.]
MPVPRTSPLRDHVVELFARLRPWLPTLVAAGLAALAFLALHRLSGEIRYSEVLAEVRSVPASALLLAGLFTLLSFVALAGYDASGLAYLGVRLPLRTLALGSFAGYALGNTVGFGMLTGGAVRMRVYGAAGLEPAQVARLMAFIAAGFGLGISCIGALGLLWGAGAAEALLPLAPTTLRGLALLVLLGIVALIGFCVRGQPLRLGGGRSLRLPSGRLALAQLAVSAADILCTAVVLWVLLPPSAMSFGVFLCFFALAIALGVISHVPGGLGVFEAVILLAFHGLLPPQSLAGALLLYRAIYYLAPLALAVLLLVIREWRAISQSRVRQQAAELSPLFLSVATFTVGLMLLVSGVTPSTDEATELLALRIPLVFVEGAHFLGSIAGLGLLFVARGLLLRLDAAWWAAALLAAVSLLFALPKGIALGEMAALSVLLLLLIAGRQEFDRRASLFAQPLSLHWTLTVIGALGAVVWLLFFVYRDVGYSSDLWWQFAFDAHAPRSLRATLSAVLLAFGYSLWQAFRPASGDADDATPADLDRAQAIIRDQPRADAMLALMGDKSFLFSDSGKAFLMYGKRARTWAALYDPVGPEQEWPELIWRFVELAHEHGGRACFYQAGSRNLALYVDVGMSAYKLGEYAFVPLRDFSLQGSRRAHLRQAVNKGEQRDGLRFELLPAEAVPALLPELRAISDAWLAQHASREKSFSLGAFEPDYLGRTPVAVARKDGQLVAFANLMSTALKTEATIDLMRYTPQAPRGVMDYLFVKLMLHCQAEGYEKFGLGMAPMSGMSEHRNAPNWQRLGRLIYRHGANFYNFQGLRAFKDKFDPVWEPRYLCAEGGLKPILAFTDIAALVSGGIKGVLAK